MYRNEYPLNLMLQLNFDQHTDLLNLEENFDRILSDYFEEENCFLSEREKTVIILRYKAQKSLVEIGKDFGITRERVRQIESRALKKLNYITKQRPSILYLSYNEYCQLKLEAENKKQEIVDEIKGLTDLLSKVRWLISNKESVTLAEAEKFLLEHEETKNSLIGKSLDIADLELSVRSYNCLRRAGYKTVEDLSTLTKNKMMKIRNLGKKSMKEIIEALDEIGIEIN